KNVSLRIVSGEFVVVRGASGSGKSTLLNILGCLDQPTRGSYRLDGEDVARYDDKQLSRLRNAKIGFIFQSFNLLPRTTALENVEIPMVYSQGKVDRQKALAALERVGLAARASHFATELSGGEQQRVAIARALAMHPALLMFDEPTSALDPRRSAGLRSLLRGFVERGHTMVVVSHSIGFLEGLADNLLYMEGGEVVEYGETEKILNSPGDPRTKDFVQQAN
ncbi:MAG TPA: ABC transporter ATP-binding protein, partial [Pyrinomonadaceae bacterium]